MGDSPHPFAITTSPSSTPPVPVAAGYSVGLNVWTVVFDQSLQPGVSSSANWQGVREGAPSSYDAFVVLADPTIAGNVVTGQGTITIPGSGPSRISYAATPPDLVGTNGLPVAAFVDYPVVVGP
jgi:hypothetical protein